jgi:hypothetical protein
MARYWDNKEIDGRGTKFCLVIDPEDGTNPIRTYGWTKDEVLEKVARTAETAQQTISRQRNTPPTAAAPAVTRAVATARVTTVTADEQMQATADLSNPAKAPEALKTLLKVNGFDLDQEKFNRDTRRVANLAQEWERRHPEFPDDERNQRMLLDRATMKAGFPNITAAVLDECFTELLAQNMLFEASAPEPITPPSAPDGNPENRVERPRAATSYRSSALRAPVQPPAKTKPKYTRAEIDAMNSKVFREKFETEAGFKELVNAYAQQAAS